MSFVTLQALKATGKVDSLHLDSGLRQVDLQRHLLPHEDIRVPGFCEKGLQDVELGARESGAFTSLLPGSRFTKKQTQHINIKENNIHTI